MYVYTCYKACTIWAKRTMKLWYSNWAGIINNSKAYLYSVYKLLLSSDFVTIPNINLHVLNQRIYISLAILLLHVHREHWDKLNLENSKFESYCCIHILIIIQAGWFTTGSTHQTGHPPSCATYHLSIFQTHTTERKKKFWLILEFSLAKISTRCL